MSKILELNSQNEWSKSEKTIFKFFSTYFFLQVLPLDLRFIKHFFSINWLNLQYRDIFYLSKYSPSFTGDDSFLNWLIITILALIGTVLWIKFIPKKPITTNFIIGLEYWFVIVWLLALSLMAS